MPDLANGVVWYFVFVFSTEFDFILVQLAAAPAAGWQRCGSVVNGHRKRLEVHGICPPAGVRIYRNYCGLEPFRLYFRSHSFVLDQPAVSRP
jgi:hypothetical protein